MKKLFFIALIIIAGHTFAQSSKAIEAELVKSYKQIEYWSALQPSDKTGVAGEKLEDAKLDFGGKLKKTISNPSTISWTFKALSAEHVNIVTSGDNKLRIYSWYAGGGGQMHFFENFVQYRNGAQITAADIPTDSGSDPGSYYTQIITAKLAGKTYYLVVRNGIYSSKDYMQAIRVFAITDGKLDLNIKLFKIGNDLKNKLVYDYDPASTTNGKVPPVITYDAAKQIIHLPVIDGKGKVGNGEVLFRFNGKCFERN